MQYLNFSILDQGVFIEERSKKVITLFLALSQTELLPQDIVVYAIY